MENGPMRRGVAEHCGACAEVEIGRAAAQAVERQGTRGPPPDIGTATPRIASWLPPRYGIRLARPFLRPFRTACRKIDGLESTS